MIVRRALAVVSLLAVAGFAARAQEPEPQPSLAPVVTAAGRTVLRAATNSNVVPATFRAQLVVDNRFPPKVKPPKDDDDRDPRDRTGKIHCLVCEHGLSPVVAVFVRGNVALDKVQVTDGLSKLIKGTDTLIPKYRSDKLAGFAMFLKLEGGKKAVPVKDPVPGGPENIEVDLEYPHDEMRDAKAAEVKNYAGVVGAENVPFGLHPDKSVSITAFGIGDATPVTVILYNRLRTVQRWELKLDELTDEKVAEVLAATEEMIRGKKLVP